MKSLLIIFMLSMAACAPRNIRLECYRKGNLENVQLKSYVFVSGSYDPEGYDKCILTEVVNSGN